MYSDAEDSDKPMADQCSEVMEKISKQAERAGAVIKQIRHFVNKDLPDKKPVKVSQMLNVVLDLTHMEIDEERLILSWILMKL